MGRRSGGVHQAGRELRSGRGHARQDREPLYRGPQSRGGGVLQRQSPGGCHS